MNTKDNENIGLKGIVVKYLLHWKLFLGAFLFSFVVAILYLIFYPPTYEIRAAVQIQEERDAIGGGIGLGEASGLMKSFGLSGMGGGSVNMEDELRIFQSNKLFREMILELGLNVEYAKPYTWGYKLYNTANFIVKADSQTEMNLDEDIVFDISAKGSSIQVVVKSNSAGKKKYDFSSLPADIILPQGVFTVDYSIPNQKSQSSIHVKYRPVSDVADELLKDFLIEDYSKTSNVIELTCSDYEKKRGLDMLTNLIACYNRQHFSYKKKELLKSIDYYDFRIDSVVTELARIELLIEKYKHQNKLTDIQTDVLFYAEQMKEFQLKLVELESQVYAINIMSDFVSDSTNKYNIVPMLLAMETGEKNPIVTYNEILLERNRIIQNSSIENPLVSALSEQADKMRSGVVLTIGNARQSLQYVIDDLKNKEKLLLNKMEDYPFMEREFVDLKRKQEIFQGIYLLLLQKREEAALTVGLEKDKARIVESPFVISKAVAPRKLYAAIGIFLFTLCIPVLYLLGLSLFMGLKNEFRRAKNEVA